MKRVTAAVAAVVVALFLWALPANATAHPNYPLGRAKTCRVNYHKVNREHWVTVHGKRVKRTYVDCVYRAPKTTLQAIATSPTTITVAPTLGVRLDPSYVQSTANPLKVTWSYSASANVDGNPDPSLPSGVLEFFSNGVLVDSTDVGGSVTSAQSAVTYANYGEQTVDVIYDSGTDSATTGTETFDIEPPPLPPLIATTTVLSVEQGACSESTPVLAIVNYFPVTWEYEADYQCAYTFTIATTDASGNTLTSGLSTTFCTPADGQTTCSFTYADMFAGSPSYDPDSPGTFPSPNSSDCASAEGSVTASFAGNSTDAASVSAAQTISPLSFCPYG